MRERIAWLISNILNPFLMSGAVLVLLAFHDTTTTGEALKWSAITLAISVLPVFVVVIWLVKRRKMDGLYDNTRRQRRLVYILASLLGAIGCGAMWLFNAPELLAVTFTAGFAELVIFMAINYYWKISLHMAFTAGAVTVVTLVYGVEALWTLVFLPLVGWSRVQLKQHTLAQVISGGALAAAIVAGVFGGFGVIG
jgi:membrane-associated phospholipid phosphatase